MADELLTLALRAAAAGADVVAGGRAEARATVGSKSSATDAVTEIDRRSEQTIVELIVGARPDDAIVGEEHGDRAGTSGVTWLIDPLDGTVNYLYGFPAYAVSVAAHVDGEPAVGVVIDVARGERWAAVAGGGATLDGQPLPRRADPPALAGALVGTGFSYAADRRAAQGAVAAALLAQVRDLRRAGAAALDLCWTAAGRLDGYYEAGLGPWDLAAGAIVAAECGVTLSDGAGGPVRPEQVVAAPEPLHAEMVAALAAAGWEAK